MRRNSCAPRTLDWALPPRNIRLCDVGGCIIDPMRDYTWARRTIPRGTWTIEDLSMGLGVSRHQSRRRLLSSRLPYRMITRRWRDPHSGIWYSRKVIAVPDETATILFLERLKREWQSFERYGFPFPTDFQEALTCLREQCARRRPTQPATKRRRRQPSAIPVSYIRYVGHKQRKAGV